MDQACASFFADKSLRAACRDHQDLTIVNYNTRELPCLLERCLSHLGLGLVVLGGEKDDWRWDYKISLVWEYLQSGACHSEYVLCLDGDDVLVLSEPALILSRFLECNCELLFTSSAWNHPASQECWRFEESVAAPADRAHCHLNAVGYLGRRGYLTARLDEIMTGLQARSQWCMTPGGFDDQLAWRQLHRRHFSGDESRYDVPPVYPVRSREVILRLRSSAGPTSSDIGEAFYQASHSGQRRMSEYLLAQGADINASPRYAHHQTALQVAGAADTRRQLLVDWIEERGAPTADADQPRVRWSAC